MRSARCCMPISPRCPRAISGIEANAVILDRQAHLATRPPQLDAGAVRIGVLDDVVQRLLRHAVEGLLDVQRQALFGLDLDRHRQAGAPLDRRTVVAQRLGQAIGLQALRAQLEDQGPHLGQGVPLQLLQLGACHRLGVTIQQHLQRAGGQAHAEQRLRDGES